MAVDVRWMCGGYAGRVICLSNISWRIEYCFCRYKLFPDYIAQVEGLVFTNWVNYRTERTAFIINKPKFVISFSMHSVIYHAEAQRGRVLRDYVA